MFNQLNDAHLPEQSDATSHEIIIYTRSSSKNCYSYRVPCTLLDDMQKEKIAGINV